jgi:hypothetical protein
MKHSFIVSLPRSGSTVLTRLISSREDVVCLPETFFPHLLDHISERDSKDARRMAAMFVASCPDGCPLTLDEAEECVSHEHAQTLSKIALKVATKEGRNPDLIKSAVWKSTRLVGSNKSIAKLDARFIILTRPRLNVYESQFRVPFGARNKNPARFALFASSYDAAFRRYPSGKTLQVEYATIPERLDELCCWIGSTSDRENRSIGSVQATSGQRAWHSEIDKPFHDDDTQKLANLSVSQICRYKTTAALLDKIPFIKSLARSLADRREADGLVRKANDIFSSNTTNRQKQ